MMTSISNLIERGRYLGLRGDQVAVWAVTGAGSVGDQAMMEVVREHIVQHLGHRLVFVYFAAWKHTELRCEVPTAVVWNARPNATRLAAAKLFLRSRAMAMIGADIVDGTYSAVSILSRLQLMRYAQRAGVKIAVLGASISSDPDPSVIRAMAGLPSLVFHAREGCSQDRYQQFTGRQARLVADLAFLLKPELRSESALQVAQWMAQRRSQGGRIVGVNANGLMLAGVPTGIPCYVEVIGTWLEVHQNDAVLLIPHDLRPAPIGDLDVMHELFAALTPIYGERVQVLRPRFDAWDVKAVCGHLDLVITGRMHLAIAALGMGVPPLCISYQGKFEGLMELFGLRGMLCFPSILETPQQLFHRLTQVARESRVIRREIIQVLPRIHELALGNFSWLDESVERSSGNKCDLGSKLG
jgi:polysaccharide pyruvyl transferase WcaK-like protein